MKPALTQTTLRLLGAGEPSTDQLDKMGVAAKKRQSAAKRTIGSEERLRPSVSCLLMR